MRWYLAQQMGTMPDLHKSTTETTKSAYHLHPLFISIYAAI
jgi:hypothetical protein